jgi:thymidylate synthase (FAD)
LELLINAGDFELLTPPDELRAQMRRMERAGRTCYQSEIGEITDVTAENFVRKILHQFHHESVIEHSSLTVKFTGVCRGFTHELVRHRLASFSQESTRYVDYAKSETKGAADIVDLDRFELRCVAPPHRDVDEKFQVHDNFTGHVMKSYRDMLEEMEANYKALRKAGWVPQDARQILPIATESDIVVTANWREWRHILTMRTGKPAHWEIRRVMCNLLQVLQETIPVIFEDFVEAGTSDGVLYYSRFK